MTAFLNKIKQDYELIAPIKTDIVRYDLVDDPSEINLVDMPYYSFKKYLQPPKYKIADIKDGKLEYNFDVPKRVIFGAWPGDLKSLPMLDKLFLEEPADPYYKSVRENIYKDDSLADREKKELDKFIYDYKFQDEYGNKYSEFMLEMNKINQDPKKYAKFLKFVKNFDSFEDKKVTEKEVTKKQYEFLKKGGNPLEGANSKEPVKTSKKTTVPIFKF